MHIAMPELTFGGPAAIVVKITVIVLLAGGTVTLLRERLSGAARHFIWASAVVAALLLFPLSAAMPGWIAVRLDGAPKVIPAENRPVRQDALSARSFPANDITLPVERNAPPISWPTVLAGCYTLGVLVLAIRFARNLFVLRRTLRHASDVNDDALTILAVDCASRMRLRSGVRLLRSDDATIPMTIGIHRPAILLPPAVDTWDSSRRRAVLLHELAHVARRDCLTELAASLACTLYWIHPGVWWLARRQRLDREIACDDRVLATGMSALEYAGHLIDVAYTGGDRRAPALAATMAHPRQLERRVMALIADNPRRNEMSWYARVAGAATVLALLVPIATGRAAVVESPVGAPHAAVATAAIDDRGGSTTVDSKAERRAAAIAAGRRNPPHREPVPPSQQAPALTAQAPVTPPQTSIPPQTHAHTVSRGDTLAISVSRFPELSRKYTVKEDGTLRFPLIGEVRAAGRTTLEVASEIEAGLRPAYIREPQVAVEIDQPQGSRVYVFGRGGTGMYPLNPGDTIVDVMRGTGNGSAPEAVVIRRPERTSAVAPTQPTIDEAIRINLREVDNGPVFELRDQDTIYVPRGLQVVVAGHVVKPGRFDVAERATVRDAIAAAGGFIAGTPPAVLQVVRYVAGERKVLDVSLDDPIYFGDTIVAGSER